MVQSYIPEEVSQVRSLHANVLYAYREYTIGERLEMMADNLFRALKNKDLRATIEVTNYHPTFLGKPPAIIFESTDYFMVAHQTIASEFGFKCREDISLLLQKAHDVVFEEVIDIMLAGDLERLKIILGKNPGLLRRKIYYGHEATLLHYCGNNGVELYRQQVPSNLPDIIRHLIEEGTDINGLMQVYGGTYTALQLFETSGHPYHTDLRDEAMGAFNTSPI